MSIASWTGSRSTGFSPTRHRARTSTAPNSMPCSPSPARVTPSWSTAWIDWRVISTICANRSEEHTSELQSLMRISYAVFCLKKKKNKNITYHTHTNIENNTNNIVIKTNYITTTNLYTTD